MYNQYGNDVNLNNAAFQQQPYGYGVVPGGYQTFYGGVNPMNRYQRRSDVPNLLTEEDLKILNPGGEKFTLSLSDLEVAKARCLHRNKNGALLQKQPGSANTYKCAQCGTVVQFGMPVEEAFDVIDKFKNIVECTKYIDGITEDYEQLFYAAGIADKFKVLYKMLVRQIEEAANVRPGFAAPRANFGGSPFDRFNSIVNGTAYPGMMGSNINAYGNIGDPNAQIYYQQQQMYQQPGMNVPPQPQMPPQQGMYSAPMAPQMPPQQPQFGNMNMTQQVYGQAPMMPQPQMPPVPPYNGYNQAMAFQDAGVMNQHQPWAEQPQQAQPQQKFGAPGVAPQSASNETETKTTTQNI